MTAGWGRAAFDSQHHINVMMVVVVVTMMTFSIVHHTEGAQKTELP
jgi:hypothetical protein